MSFRPEDIPDQSGRIFLVTGANTGLGFQTSKALLKKGATVIMSCRSLDKGKLAKESLLETNKSGTIHLLKLDLSDLNEIKKFSAEIKNRFGFLDVLINNAGIMAPPQTLSKQGLEIQFAVNHLSHMALTLELLPLMSNIRGSKVVTVTSGAQYMGKIAWGNLQGEIKYDRWSSYSQSKLANVMFAIELEKRLRANKSETFSLLAHPGLAKTNLQANSIMTSNSWVEALAYKLMSPLFQSAEFGALPQLIAATRKKAKGGEQYVPRWNVKGLPRLAKVASSALQSEDREKLWSISQSLINDYISIQNQLPSNPRT